MKYNQLLDEISKKYINDSNRDKFCMDGLVMKYGEPRESVDEKWDNAKLRVAFLLKDNPDGWATDLRTWLIEGPHAKQSRELRGGKVGQTGFLPNIARMFYGLYVNSNIGYKDLNQNEVRKVWNTEPFALIETKKIAGINHVSEKEIRTAIKNDDELLKTELQGLNPNVIVCCDPSGAIFEFATNYYRDQNGDDIIKHEYDYVHDDGKIEPNMRCRAWYFKKINVLVILSFHPTRLGKANWKIYERVVSPLRTFPKKEELIFKPLNKKE